MKAGDRVVELVEVYGYRKARLVGDGLPALPRDSEIISPFENMMPDDCNHSIGVFSVYAGDESAVVCVWFHDFTATIGNYETLKITPKEYR